MNADDPQPPVTTDAERPSPPAWWIYYGDGVRRSDWTLPEPPPWRRFDGVRPETGEGPGPEAEPCCDAHTAEGPGRTGVATTYRAEPEEARMVNAAIHLRRPLLVTGKPGTGKSTLAHGIAHELGLGRVLHWSVTSRTTLADGLYAYDAIGRLQDEKRDQGGGRDEDTAADIGTYLRLGPLGTALLPSDRPRVLLIDELDKGDVDLPNDLLSVLEDGQFTIPELQRYPVCDVHVMTDDGLRREPVRHGRVRCAEFPLVVLTSNGEREFPPAFVRRCVRLDIRPPSRQKLDRIVRAHLGPEVLRASGERLEAFAKDLEEGRKLLATDQLLNTLRLEHTADHTGDPEWPTVLRELLRPLNDTA